MDCELKDREDLTGKEFDEEAPNDCPIKKRQIENLKDSGLLKQIQKSRELGKTVAESLSNMKIDIPAPTAPKIKKIPNVETEKEKAKWKRHIDLLEYQKGIVEGLENIQDEQETISEEQESTSKMTLAILTLTVILTVIGVLSLLKPFLV